MVMSPVARTQGPHAVSAQLGKQPNPVHSSAG
jgi:hypothetical protein